MISLDRFPDGAFRREFIIRRREILLLDHDEVEVIGRSRMEFKWNPQLATVALSKTRLPKPKTKPKHFSANQRKVNCLPMCL